MDGVLRDLRFAIRSLLHAPVLSATAILTLAIGTGLATGVFAVAYGVLLRPLPFAEPDRVVHISTRFLVRASSGDDRDSGILLAEFDEWRSRLRTFESLAASGAGQFTVRGAGEPRIARGALVTDRFFETLAARAAGGSMVSLVNDPGAVVLSAAFADQLGAAPFADGGGITLGTSSFRIAAVMASVFAYPSDDVEFWVRADAVPGVTFYNARDQRRFSLVGRLAPGVSLQQAQDDVRRVVREIDASAKAGSEREATVLLVRDEVRAASAPTIVPFAFGAALVLLIACANVSGLLGGRAISRRREFAVRRALGGGVSHVLRASLAESVTIAMAGWAVGIWLAYLFVRVFVSLAGAAVPNLHGVRIDAPVVLASLALAAVVALLSGSAPAFRAARADPGGALKDTSERTGRGGRRLRGLLVVAQIAMAVVLLVAAGLLVRTVRNIVRGERGFVAEHALTERLMLTQTVRFAATERAPFVNGLVSAVRALPGVVSAGIGSDLPPGPTQLSMTIRVVSENRDETFQLGYSAATPGYLEAIGAELVRGRLFDERDRVAQTPSAIVTETAARLLFQDRDPIGREWPAPMPGADGTRVRPRVIGVVRDIRYGGLDHPVQATLFAPWEKLAPGVAHLVVRTSGPPTSVAAAVRGTIQRLDPSMPIATARTLDDVVNASIADRRLRVTLAMAFAALALALASIALWGLVAQGVLDRRHELAVRLALGSTSGGAIRLMLRDAGVLTGVGLAIGAAGAAGAARALRHLLHGVRALDPLSFVGACVTVAAISLVACYVPARRAAAVSPTELLRE